MKSFIPQIWQGCTLGWSCRQQRSRIYWRGRPCSPARERMSCFVGHWIQRLSHREWHRIHFHQHLQGEEGEEDEVGVLLEVVQPLRLVVMLCCLQTDSFTICIGEKQFFMMATWMIVLRKTKVMISQNMNWDLQMYRTVRRFFRFHLRKENI